MTRRRYAIKIEPCMTLFEVASSLGVTPERTRQIETAALRKLKVALEARGFSRDDFLD